MFPDIMANGWKGVGRRVKNEGDEDGKNYGFACLFVKFIVILASVTNKQTINSITKY